MKNSLVAPMAVFLLKYSVTPVYAISIDVEVAYINLNELYVTSGAFTDNSDFGIVSEIPGYYQFLSFSSFDAIEYFEDQTGISQAFYGTSPFGDTYNYQFTLSAGQFAWGAVWGWDSGTNIPLLIIFDCGNGDPGDSCQGDSLPMQTTPFPGAVWNFDGVVRVGDVPVPAAVWLFCSGLIGLISIAIRKKP